MTMTAVILRREVFSVSRLAEFTNRQILTTATGASPEQWPLYITKELVDNAVDNSEEHDRAPAITLEAAGDRIAVADNGSGITGEIIDRILDFSNQTSSRACYVSPSRGRQGNALQTVLAIPFVLDGTSGRCLIGAHGRAHDIEFSVNPLTREPQTRRAESGSSVKTGTRVTVHWPMRASRTWPMLFPTFYRLPRHSLRSTRT
jgi:DNA topoisomerase VI subunit B